MAHPNEYDPAFLFGNEPDVSEAADKFDVIEGKPDQGLSGPSTAFSSRTGLQSLPRHHPPG
jgi:hypothetical protein